MNPFIILQDEYNFIESVNNYWFTPFYIMLWQEDKNYLLDIIK